MEFFWLSGLFFGFAIAIYGFIFLFRLSLQLERVDFDERYQSVKDLMIGLVIGCCAVSWVLFVVWIIFLFCE